MKKVILTLIVIQITFSVKAQNDYISGQTKLINPTGRTLLIEKDDDDSWLTFHDPSNSWYSIGIDKSNSNSFSLNYGGDLNSSQFVMDSNGKVGIGISNPKAILDVGKFIPDGALGTVFGRLQEGNSTLDGTYLGVKGFQTQGTDIKNIKSFSIIHNFYGLTNSSINFFRGGGTTGGFLTFNTNNDSEKMRILGNGNIGIGTTKPDMKLTVKGNIHAEEVKIDLNVPAPDYVFQKDYNLRSIEDVEKFINENSHLPEIPSAKEFEQNGVMQAEMDMNLLKKIEELTLYTIQQQKEIENLKKENKELKSLSDRLVEIEKLLESKK